MESSQLSHSVKTLNPVLAGNPLMQRRERLPETDLFESKGEKIKDKERKTGLLESICESATDSVTAQHNRYNHFNNRLMTRNVPARGVES